MHLLEERESGDRKRLSTFSRELGASFDSDGTSFQGGSFEGAGLQGGGGGSSDEEDSREAKMKKAWGRPPSAKMQPGNMV
jgi:hypothetical protein